MRPAASFHSKPACARRAGVPPHCESLAGALGIPEFMPPVGGELS